MFLVNSVLVLRGRIAMFTGQGEGRGGLGARAAAPEQSLRSWYARPGIQHSATDYLLRLSRTRASQERIWRVSFCP